MAQHQAQVKRGQRPCFARASTGFNQSATAQRQFQGLESGDGQGVGQVDAPGLWAALYMEPYKVSDSSAICTVAAS